MIHRLLSRLFSLFASLELAVFIIVSMAVAFAVGTVFESQYDAKVAKAVIYGSWWMYILLFLFMINVAAAAISRWPWRSHHTGFLVTHLGIIILLSGSLLTKLRGIDGILALAVDEEERYVELDGKQLNVYRAQTGKSYELLSSSNLPFNEYYTLSAPLSIALAGDKEVKNPLVIKQYWPKAERQVNAKQVANGYPAIQFRLSGSRANVADWLFLTGKQTSSVDLGPAIVQFRQGKPQAKIHPKNTLYVYFLKSNPQELQLLKFTKDNPKPTSLGKVSLNKPIAVGWMDFHLMIQAYYQSAAPELYYTPLNKRSPGMGMAKNVNDVIQVEFAGEKTWLELGSSAQIPGQDAIYYLQYVPKRVDIGFAVNLKKFTIENYQGSSKAKSYESLVAVNSKQYLIQMNEPLKLNGFTLYQSSYSTDDEGNPVYSVLSVNRDPGRWVKYAGSLMICLGILLMFYFKPIYSGNNRFLLSKGGSHA